MLLTPVRGQLDDHLVEREVQSLSEANNAAHKVDVNLGAFGCLDSGAGPRASPIIGEALYGWIPERGTGLLVGRLPRYFKEGWERRRPRLLDAAPFGRRQRFSRSRKPCHARQGLVGARARVCAYRRRVTGSGLRHLSRQPW